METVTAPQTQLKRVKDYCPKASDAIFAMIKGLKKPWVEVDMDSYGDARKKRVLGFLWNHRVCFGCAATNTLCEVFQKKFPKDMIEAGRNRAGFLGLELNDLSTFETMINDVRQGRFHELFSYYNIEDTEVRERVYAFFRPGMTTKNYLQTIPSYGEIANYLKSKGY